MKHTPLLIAAALTLALTACTSTAKETPAPTAAPTPPLETTAPEELTWADQLFSEDFTADDGTVVLSADYAFPDIPGYAARPAWTKIHDYYAAEGAAYLADAAELSGWAADDYTLSAATGGNFTPYHEQTGWRVSHQTDALVSLVRNYYADSVTGAAHPANYQFSEQFDLATGDKLTLDSFFTDPAAARSRILDLLEEKGRDSGFTRSDLESAFHEEYFYLTGEGFVFYYQPDALAPYESGLLEFSLPYADLSDLMSRDV